MYKIMPPSGLRDGVIGGIFWRDCVIQHNFLRDRVFKTLAWCVIEQNFEAWCVICPIFRDFRVMNKFDDSRDRVIGGKILRDGVIPNPAVGPHNKARIDLSDNTAAMLKSTQKNSDCC